VQSQDDSHIDVICHKPITNNVVVGEKYDINDFVENVFLSVLNIVITNRIHF